MRTEFAKNMGVANPEESYNAAPHLVPMDVANAVLFILGNPQNVLVSKLETLNVTSKLFLLIVEKVLLH